MEFEVRFSGDGRRGRRLALLAGMALLAPTVLAQSPSPSPTPPPGTSAAAARPAEQDEARRRQEALTLFHRMDDDR
ncbi:MAG: hypothetical protein ACM3SU_03420, partial [Acidobacteriota bacterium]